MREDSEYFSKIAARARHLLSKTKDAGTRGLLKEIVRLYRYEADGHRQTATLPAKSLRSITYRSECNQMPD